MPTKIKHFDSPYNEAGATPLHPFFSHKCIHAGNALFPNWKKKGKRTVIIGNLWFGPQSGCEFEDRRADPPTYIPPTSHTWRIDMRVTAAVTKQKERGRKDPILSDTHVFREERGREGVTLTRVSQDINTCVRTGGDRTDRGEKCLRNNCTCVQIVPSICVGKYRGHKTKVWKFRGCQFSPLVGRR